MCVLCAFDLFVCTQVSCCWSRSTFRAVVYNYVYVCYVHFICLCVCVYPSELLLESLHIQGCLYIIMYMCVMCILSVYVFVPSQLLLESLHTLLSELLLEFPRLGLCVYMCLSELLLEFPRLGLCVYMCLSELLLEFPRLGLCVYMCLSELFHAWVCVYICA